MIRTLVDSGPLVAFYDRKDNWHRWANEQMDALTPPLLTTEPVLTEACFLLQRGTVILPSYCALFSTAFCKSPLTWKLKHLHWKR